MMRSLLLLCLAVSGHVLAEDKPRVLLDTDHGPMLLELDAERAPRTVANFLTYVEAGTYDRTLLHRVAKDFVVQGGGRRENDQAVTRRPAITSERGNGLSNVYGALAMALSGNPPNINSATSDFYINTGNNARLDEHFTVFGRVVFGLRTLTSLNTTPIRAFTADVPVRPPLVKRAMRVAEGRFPLLPLHSGAWYDPANPGRGIAIDVAHAAGAETGPLITVAWYDYRDGQQIWVNGMAPFQWGASEVEVPLQITSGGEFGSAFDPSQVVLDHDWGRVTVRFDGCDAATFTYTSADGDGVLPMRRLTLPVDALCKDN